MSEHKNICPICPKGCSLEEPGCGRGRRYLEEGSNGTSRGRHHDMTTDEKLVKFLHIGSHTLHHKGGGKNSQRRILNILNSHGSMTQRQLMDILEISSASLSEILGKIESGGYIVRKKSEEDKRNVDISLTETGEEAVAAMKQEQKEAAMDWFAPLTEEEKETLAELLEKLVRSWKQEGHGKHKCHGRHKHHGRHIHHGKHHEHRHIHASD